MREIVKAEILWSRRCNVGCQYCNMATGKRNTLSLENWLKGIDNLKELDCGFIAFYGAEPLMEFEMLGEVVGYAESLGIHTTIITSGAVAMFHRQLEKLYEQGAKSISMSYDIEPFSPQSTVKTNKAILSLKHFQHYATIRDGCRDVAAITTLTRKNFRHLPKSIVTNSMQSIWTFFDFIHADRGQPGSKCRNFSGMDELMFQREDIKDLLDVLSQVEVLKDQGYMCHTSKAFLDIIRDKTKDGYLSYSWHCGDYRKLFPSWVTIDCDGLVYPCDDFQPQEITPCIYNLAENWSCFKSFWLERVQECPGCLWNTHIDAHLIKEGALPFSDYVHT